ncbi:MULTISPECIES: acyl carrier protein [Butyricimonas]|uniref:acyl carrier protein n=1 Tax=Butyricimonas TaxID=574697 RepID=UPI0021044168|nr:acyl carrier protein [Butyricimonas sp. DFI.6.44]
MKIIIMEQKYNKVFTEVFGVAENVLNDDFSKDSVKEWDSVHQLNVIALLEETFDIMFEPEDIMSFTSYKTGKEILRVYGVEI